MESTPPEGWVKPSIPDDYLILEESCYHAQQPKTSARPYLPKVPILALGNLLHDERPADDIPETYDFNYVRASARASARVSARGDSGYNNPTLLTASSGLRASTGMLSLKPSFRSASPSVSTCSGSFSRGNSPVSTNDRSSRSASPRPQMLPLTPRSSVSSFDGQPALLRVSSETGSIMPPQQPALRRVSSETGNIMPPQQPVLRRVSSETGNIMLPQMKQQQRHSECSLHQCFAGEPYMHSRSEPVSRPPLPRSWSEHPRNMLDDRVTQAMAVGDLLYVPGTGGRLVEIGTSGGFMGHFLVVLGRPYRIVVGSNESQKLAAVWPSGATEVWRVPVLESTRAVSGLHEVELLISLDRTTGKFFLCAEISLDGHLCLLDNEAFELWQSPSKVRQGLRADLMREVAAEMKSSCGSWSITTAARALFRSAHFSSTDKSELLTEIKACWNADPICTSVVIIFWQRYLCRLADVAVDVIAHPSDLILEVMPLKADRGLPGDVLRALKECGWTAISTVPAPCPNPRSRSNSDNVPPQRPSIPKIPGTHRWNH